MIFVLTTTTPITLFLAHARGNYEGIYRYSESIKYHCMCSNDRNDLSVETEPSDVP